MRTTHHTGTSKERTHNLEREKSRLVRELAAVNSLLRRKGEVQLLDKDWDYDPRLECGL